MYFYMLSIITLFTPITSNNEPSALVKDGTGSPEISFKLLLTFSVTVDTSALASTVKSTSCPLTLSV